MTSLLTDFIIYCVGLTLVVWMAGAIYFDVGQASAAGALLAIAWFAVAIGSLVHWQPAWKPLLLLLACGGCFLAWWFSLRPSLDRPWHPHFARLPRVDLCDDQIAIENVRNAQCEADIDSSPRYETRHYRFSQLCGVDALIAYWGSPWMCHPMFVFDFGADGRVCFSIEVRYRVGQKYNFIRSIYRQQELMCVVCDERDAILRRTRCTPSQDVYLYRLHGDAIRMRSFFLEYVNTINLLADRPRWYHGLTTNCTTSIYTQGRGRMRWDWRMLFNGRLDKLMYDMQLLDQSLPFAELKQQSKINDIANADANDEFSEAIRRNLPGYRRSAVLAQSDVAVAGSDVS